MFKKQMQVLFILALALTTFPSPASWAQAKKQVIPLEMAQITSVRKQVDARIDALSARMAEISDWMYKNPESGFRVWHHPPFEECKLGKIRHLKNLHNDSNYIAKYCAARWGAVLYTGFLWYEVSIRLEAAAAAKSMQPRCINTRRSGEDAVIYLACRMATANCLPLKKDGVSPSAQGGLIHGLFTSGFRSVGFAIGASYGVARVDIGVQQTALPASAL